MNFKRDKTIIILLLLIIGVGGMLRMTGFFDKKVEYPETPRSEFVSLNQKGFEINGEPFFPITMNYKVSLQGDETDVWPCSYKGYDVNSEYHYFDKETALKELLAELKLIKKMGFNSVRVVGIGEPYYIQSEEGDFVSIGYSKENRNASLRLTSEENYDVFLGAIQTLYDVAEEAGLKVILLIQMELNFDPAEEFLRKITNAFKENTTVLAYDLFNEPLYFDSARSVKTVVYPIVKKWNNILKENAPYHLSTIGLAGIREVFGWDPNILDVDFISYHPYEYEPEQVRNELYWYGEQTTKPWIIGETSIPADNDSVPYKNQKEFAKKTLKQAKDCGAIGYSWWQYKDVSWGDDFHQNYMGVVNQEGKTDVDGFMVYGTPKLTAEAFLEFDANSPKEDPVFLSNYYNYSEHDSFKLTGKLLDKKGKPISGGVVLAWNEWWSDSYHTTTKEDGSFELLSDFELYHWMASAVNKEMVRGDIDPKTAIIDSKDGIPFLDIGTFNLDKWDIERKQGIKSRIKSIFTREAK